MKTLQICRQRLVAEHGETCKRCGVTLTLMIQVDRIDSGQIYAVNLLRQRVHRGSMVS